MPSQLHEVLLQLFRNRPGLAPELLRDALHQELPSYTEARIDSADLSEVQPAEYRADLVVLAGYMQLVTPALLDRFPGRIINLHHGLLPSFPGFRPYQEAYACRMLTYGATCHFIVPELDAGCQIIYQSTFTASHGMKLEEILRRGQEDNEPHCLVEGVRRVVDGEVQLHFNRVVARK